MKKSFSKLAICGGLKIVKIPQPHFIWPPLSNAQEKIDLGAQRDKDISIKGSSGPIKELENNFKKFLGNKVKYAITFNSGTSALLAAYFALGIEEGDEVIGPAFTYHAAMSPLFILKASPILADVNINTSCIDPDQIVKHITKKTKAIIVVHQWGHPADMDKILKISKKYNLKIIEDCSHAHGSKYKGKLVGTFGDIGVFSFQANKIVFAGEGGILVTNSSEYNDRATLLGHYRDRSRDNVIDPSYQKFWFTGYGLKLRMSPYNAITAIHALKEVKKRITSRRKCLKYFSTQLEQFPELTIPYIDKNIDMGAWYGFKPIYNTKRFHDISRDMYIKALAAEGVEIKIPQSDSLTTLPLYTELKDKMFNHRTGKIVFHKGQFPNAELLGSSGLSIPTFTNWKESKPIMDQYIIAIKKLHENWEELVSFENGK